MKRPKKANVSSNSKIKIIQDFKNSELYKKPISYLASKLRTCFWKNQRIAFIIIVIVTFFFVGLIIYKNCIDKPQFLFVLHNKTLWVGELPSTWIYNLCVSLIDFATLPLVLITILFTIISNYSNDVYQDEARKDRAEIIEKVNQERVNNIVKTSQEEIQRPIPLGLTQNDGYVKNDIVCEVNEIKDDI